MSWDEDDEDDRTARCPECGGEVYEDADQCPHCGMYVVPTYGGGGVFAGKPWWFMLLAFLAIVGLIFSLVGPL